MSRNRIISEQSLRMTLELIEHHNKMLALVKQMERAYLARRRVLEELACANFTGDKLAFDQLAPAVMKGSTRMYYESPYKVALAMKEIRAWRDASC